MYYYVDKIEAKKGNSLVLAIRSDKVENYKDVLGENAVEYNGDNLPFYLTYDSQTDTVREATELEKVERGQLILEKNQTIINNRIVTYDKNYEKIENQKVIKKTTKELFEDGIITLYEVRNNKREELKKIRIDKLYENIKIGGNEFQVRQEDLDNFWDIDYMIKNNSIQLTDKRNWILADNTIKEFTYAELLEVLNEFIKRKSIIFEKFRILSHQLSQTNTIDDIKLIEWK